MNKSKKTKFKKKEFNIKALLSGMRKFCGYSQKDMDEITNNPRRTRKESGYISR